MSSNNLRILYFLFFITACLCFFFSFQKCANHEVSNKTLYPTFARTFPPANQVTKFIVSLLLAHNWRQFSLVVGSSTRLMEIKAKLIHLCEQFNLTINNITTYTEPYIPVLRMSEIPGIVNSTYAHTRSELALLILILISFIHLFYFVFVLIILSKSQQ